MAKQITIPDLSQLEKDIKQSTWWHQIAAYGAIVVGAIDPSHFATNLVQAVIIAVGGIVIAVDTNGKHKTAQAKITAQALANGTTTIVKGS